jgi:hypothetical protein
LKVQWSNRSNGLFDQAQNCFTLSL